MLKQRLIERIHTNGPMPFEQYMAACLYDPAHGFFTTGPLRSTRAGDFLTSPEVSQWFGTILGRAVLDVRRQLERPGYVVEAGAGSGSLLRGLRPVVEGEVAGVVAIEASPAAQVELADIADRVIASVDDLPKRFEGVVIANELLDNLPAALAVRTPPGWEERYVDADDDELVLVAAPAREAVIRWANAHAGEVRAGGIVEVQLAAEDWLRSVLQRLDQGLVLLIDYGGTKEELAPRRATGTLRTYRAHHLGPDPLLEPGATDITVDVSFDPLRALAEELGWSATLQRQDDFLESWGLRTELKALRQKELELARSGEELARLAVRSELRDAETLLHPRGLGDFRVLALSKFREPAAA